MIQFRAHDNEATVTIDESLEMQKAVFDRFVAFLKDHDCFSGESFVQCDSSQIDSVEFFSDLIDDVLKPNIQWI